MQRSTSVGNKALSKRVFINLSWVIFFLLVANVLGIISKFYFDHDTIYGLVPLFNFDTENNIPTIYSFLALNVTSYLLIFIAWNNRKIYRECIPWGGLSLIFIFLSFDELLSIHEKLRHPTADLLNTSGVFHYAWVIPYGVAFVIFSVVYFKFLLALPKNIMILFIVAGSIFVTGAIGFEMLGGWREDYLLNVELLDTTKFNHFKDVDLLINILYTLEELLEMFGIVIFIYALISYIEKEFIISITPNK